MCNTCFLLNIYAIIIKKSIEIRMKLLRKMYEKTEKRRTGREKAHYKCHLMHRTTGNIFVESRELMTQQNYLSHLIMNFIFHTLQNIFFLTNMLSNS